MDYALAITTKSVLAEAGFIFTEKAETPKGEVDGTNKVFVVANSPYSINDVEVVDSNNNLLVVSSLTKNQITLEKSPAVNTIIFITYEWTNTADDVVSGVIQEAADYLTACVETVNRVFDAIPATFKTFLRLYSAGLLMSPQYTMQNILDVSETAETKIERAEKILKSYLAKIKTVSGDKDNVMPVVADEEATF